MNAFSTDGEVFADSEFAAPGNSLLWGLGALDDTRRECTGFLIMPKSPCEWRVDAHGCYKFNNADLGFGPHDQTAHFPAFFHLRSTNFPGQVQKRHVARADGKYERQRLRRITAQHSAP